MSVSKVNIHPSMDVYGSDGEKIGTIGDVYPDLQSPVDLKTVGPESVGMADPWNSGGTEPAPVEQVHVTNPTADSGMTVAADSMMTNDSTSVTGTQAGADVATAEESAPGTGRVGTVVENLYLRVSSGGILGVGGHDLYIPSNAVTDVVPDERVTVNCGKDECARLYGTKPPFLEHES